MKTGEMVNTLAAGQYALCIKGTFNGMHATKSVEGYVYLVEDGTPYDFWDYRFSDCLWTKALNEGGHR